MKSIGIVGLPNIGKSTLFNVITKQAVPAENFPFCTIDKNLGVVEFHDDLLLKLKKALNSEKMYPPTIQFVDIAGLVKGAAKGEGLGNQFLSHIREVDLIMYLLRAFPDKNVTHVQGKVDPVEDLKTIVTELILKDLETIDKKLKQLEKLKKDPNNQQAAKDYLTLSALSEALEKEQTAYKFLKTQQLDADAEESVRSLFLLTAKPAIFVLNISYLDMSSPEYEAQIKEYKDKLSHYISSIYDSDSADYITLIDAKFLADTQQMQPEEVKAIRSELKYFADVNTIISLAYKRLNLIRFYVGNQKDVRSFFIPKDSSILTAASKIHKDLAENFVKAQVCNVEDVIKYKGFNQVKATGKIKTVGKDYTVQDKDYILILAHGS